MVQYCLLCMKPSTPHICALDGKFFKLAGFFALEHIFVEHRGGGGCQGVGRGKRIVRFTNEDMSTYTMRHIS